MVTGLPTGKPPSAPVTDKKRDELISRMAELEIREEDLNEKFTRGSGKGGQKVNKSNNCVSLTHVPSGVSVQCHKDRSLSLNRFFARRLLADAIERTGSGGKTQKEKEAIKAIQKKKNKKKKRAQGKIEPRH